MSNISHSFLSMKVWPLEFEFLVPEKTLQAYTGGYDYLQVEFNYNKKRATNGLPVIVTLNGTNGDRSGDLLFSFQTNNTLPSGMTILSGALGQTVLAAKGSADQVFILKHVNVLKRTFTNLHR